MLQQNFEANERRDARRKVSQDELNKKAILYRLASWPNLTQLTFMFSIPFGGAAWLQACEAYWPMQNTPMYHYGIASAMGYALSMFSEPLRDRKLVTLDLAAISPRSRRDLPAISPRSPQVGWTRTSTASAPGRTDSQRRTV